MYIRKKKHRQLYKGTMLALLIVVDVFLLGKAGQLIYQREIAIKMQSKVLEESLTVINQGQVQQNRRN